MGGTSIISVAHLGKWRHRKLKCLAEDHKPWKRWGSYLNSDNLIPETGLLAAVWRCLQAYLMCTKPTRSISQRHRPYQTSPGKFHFWVSRLYFHLPPGYVHLDGPQAPQIPRLGSWYKAPNIPFPHPHTHMTSLNCTMFLMAWMFMSPPNS